MPTLADLLQAKTRDEREAQLLASLNSVGFPITDWYVGAAGRTEIKALVTALEDFDSLVPQIASGGFLGPFQVGDKSYPGRQWLELKVADDYGLAVASATYTKQRISLWCAVGAGPYTIAVNQLTARSAFDDRYTNITGGVVLAGALPIQKLVLDFQAESPGAVFNRDIAGTIIELVTPLPGLFITNENLSFGGLDSAGRAVRNGYGTGTVTPQETVSGTAPTGTKRYTLRVTAAGQVTSAAASLETDDGQIVTTVPLSPIPASYNAGGGVTLAFANGGQNPSFVIGDVYTFQTPGSPIINAGSDVESSEALTARARGRWPALGDVPTEDKHIGWIAQASIDNGYGITKVTCKPSTTVAGQLDIRVATSAGAVPGGVIAALQVYVNAREGIGDLANVASAVNVNATAGGTVTVRASQAAAVKLAAITNWLAYVAQLPIGGDPPTGVVRLAELEQAIMDAGAVDVSGLTLNAVAANLSLSDTGVAVAVYSADVFSPWLDLTWVEVP